MAKITSVAALIDLLKEKSARAVEACNAFKKHKSYYDAEVAHNKAFACSYMAADLDIRNKNGHVSLLDVVKDCETEMAGYEMAVEEHYAANNFAAARMELAVLMLNANVLLAINEDDETLRAW